MIRVILSPSWFLAPDLIIEIFSFLVLLSFAIIGFKYYRISKNKKFAWLSFAFLLIGLGELSKIFMNLGLYYQFPVTYQVGKIIIQSQIVESLDVVYYTGFFLHRFLVLLGFYLIYYTVKKSKSAWEHLLILYFIIISAILTTNASYIFNITLALLLTIIYINYQSIYRETKARNTQILSIGFLILIASHLMFIFSRLSPVIYIIGDFLQLLAYIVFLYVIIKIYEHIKPETHAEEVLKDLV